MDTQALHHQQEQEHQQHLLTADAYTSWLYENYSINNGDMLLDLYEDGCTQLKYLRDHGLADDSEIVGL